MINLDTTEVFNLLDLLLPLAPIGTKIIYTYTDSNNNTDTINITLEVKESNIEAIKFYEKCGFEKVTIREKYYGIENGILMIRKFDKNEQ